MKCHFTRPVKAVTFLNKLCNIKCVLTYTVAVYCYYCYLYDILWSIAWNALFLYNRALLSGGELLVASLNSGTWNRPVLSLKLNYQHRKIHGKMITAKETNVKWSTKNSYKITNHQNDQTTKHSSLTRPVSKWPYLAPSWLPLKPGSFLTKTTRHWNDITPKWSEPKKTKHQYDQSPVWQETKKEQAPKWQGVKKTGR